MNQLFVVEGHKFRSIENAMDYAAGIYDRTGVFVAIERESDQETEYGTGSMGDQFGG